MRRCLCQLSQRTHTSTGILADSPRARGRSVRSLRGLRPLKRVCFRSPTDQGTRLRTERLQVRVLPEAPIATNYDDASCSLNTGMNTKTCTNCHRSLPFDSFNARSESIDGLQARCKDCLRVTRRAWYAANQKTEYVRIKTAAAKKRQWWTDYKATLKCERCPESHSACLDFHHVDPSKKDVNLSQAVAKGWSIRRIQAELAKCIVLCANCHRKLHSELSSM